MTRVIDLHQHVIPDFYWQASNEDGNAAGGITPARWSLEGAIAYLDEAGIDVAVPAARARDDRHLAVKADQAGHHA
jgi:hypothetical protein